MSGNIADDALMDRVFREHHIEVVLHFAAASQVGESMKEPLLYYENNLCATVALLRSMRRHEVGRIVFSSSAAVYGEPDTVPIPEESPKAPTNTYGETKLAMERLMHWCHVAYGLEYVSLRYFNAAGASPSGIIGEDHTPETHLIPLVLQAAQGRREKVSIFGDDYPTPDGTCIRDYIHTSDLASAHLLAARRLLAGEGSGIFNLGSEHGLSVRQIIDAARKVTGRGLSGGGRPQAGRRPGGAHRLQPQGQRGTRLGARSQRRREHPRLRLGLAQQPSGRLRRPLSSAIRRQIPARSSASMAEDRFLPAFVTQKPVRHIVWTVRERFFPAKMFIKVR